jgi:regulator of protease activity HflC (stomatin/prohibitin superfamily)
MIMAIKPDNRLINLGAAALFLVVLAYGAFEWTFCRVYVPEGHSLKLRYKGPLILPADEPGAGRLAEAGQIGVMREMKGPGRHFYNPIYWEREIVPDVVILPHEIGVVTCKVGDPLPPGEFLVDGDLQGESISHHRGILRKVFGPGRYRANPYAYEFKIVGTQVERMGSQDKVSGWVEIPSGYVGVITMQTDNRSLGIVAGIQDNVLPPGLYPINPREQQIDVINIGYRETSIQVDQQVDANGQPVFDVEGEPVPVSGTGISFPSNDGFDIQLDFSAIWGVMPENAAEVLRTFGNIDAVDSKVIEPQSESICRNNGSKMGAIELLVGDQREMFQAGVSEDFQKVLEDKRITLLYGLVRHIYIPANVRAPIQTGYIADELKLTRDEETKTARIEANFREAQKKVDLEADRVRADTDRQRASVLAEGEKLASEIAAETKQLIAKIDRETADLDAQKTVLLGRATAEAKKLAAEATSDKFRLAAQAFGTTEAYNKWEFAEQLPASIDLKLFYAGEGTLWTDLKNITPTLPIVAEKPTASAEK